MVPIAAAVATEAPSTPSTAREQLSFERYDGPGVTVEVSLQDGRYQVISLRAHARDSCPFCCGIASLVCGCRTHA